MTYGYTIADAANKKSFQNAVIFMCEKLGYQPDGDVIDYIDGSLVQRMKKGGHKATVEIDSQIDYVAIKSDAPLPIKCLVKWTR